MWCPRIRSAAWLGLILTSFQANAAALQEVGPDPPGDALWIEGRVELPRTAPIAARVELASRGKRHLTNDYQVREPDAAGRFRIAFPPETRKGRLLVRGDGVVPESLRIDFSSPPEELVVRPRLYARLSGQVRLADIHGVSARDLVGRQVSLGGHRYGDGDYVGRFVTRRATLDESLRFEFADLPPDLRYSVRVDARPWLEPEVEGLVLADAEHRALELEVRAGVRVEGRVEDVDGAPITGYELRGWRSDGRMSTSDIGRARVAEDGSFLVSSNPGGVLELTASHENYLSATWEGGWLEDGDHVEGVVLTLRRGAEVRGRVSWPAGAPAAGCRVVLHQRQLAANGTFGRWFACDELTTDPSGEFHRAGLAAAPVRAIAVVAAQEGRVGLAASARADDLPLDGTPRALVLAPGSTLRGRVLSDEGLPVPRFTVRAMLGSGRDVFPLADGLEAHIDGPDGTFAVHGLCEGVWQLVVEAEGHAPARLQALRLPDALPELAVRLPRRAQVRGLVTDEGGRPVAGAAIEVQQPYPGAWSGPSRGEAPASDAHGEFERDVAPGVVLVRAGAPGRVESERARLVLAPGEVRSGVQLVVGEGGRVEGRALGADGQPAAGRRVTVSGAADVEAVTDAEGRFALDGLAPGRRHLTAELAQDELREQPFDGSAGSMAHRTKRVPRASVEVRAGETATAELRPSALDPVLLRGRVRVGGAPRAEVSVYAATPGAWFGMRAVTDEDGRFEMRLQSAGLHVFDLHGPDMPGTRLVREVSADAESTLELELDGHTVTGRVVDADGAPLPAMRLHAEPARLLGVGGPYQGCITRTDTAGRFTLPNLTAGSYQLTVHDELASMGSDETEGRAAVQLLDLEIGPDSSRGELLFRLPPAGAVVGRVVDARGAPVAGADVHIRDERGRRLPFLNHRTDTDGRFVVGGIPPGNVTVWVWNAVQAGRTERAVEVRGGRTVAASVVVDRGTALHVAHDPTSGPLGLMSISVTDEDGNEFGHETFSSASRALAPHPWRPGRLFGPLVPGRYTIRAGRRDGAACERVVTLEREPLVEVRLDLEGGR